MSAGDQPYVVGASLIAAAFHAGDKRMTPVNLRGLAPEFTTSSIRRLVDELQAEAYQLAVGKGVMPTR